MAIITFDNDSGAVSVLLEKTDIVRIIDEQSLCSYHASRRSVGEMLMNEEVKLCVIRGERD